MPRFMTGWLAAALLLPAASTAHDAVSAGADGLPLDPPTLTTADGPAYAPLDVSAGGRYVLFANYPPASGEISSLADDCTIYRKDRATGELLTVFVTAPGVRHYCNGALMSEFHRTKPPTNSAMEGRAASSCWSATVSVGPGMSS